MRKNYYQFWEKVHEGAYLHYNAFNNQYLILNQEKHDLFEESIAEIQSRMPAFYQLLADNQFLVADDFDEYEVAVFTKKQMQFDASMYQIMINTTLDCNLNCWYCYENRVSGSFVTKEVIEAIKKNIKVEYDAVPFRTLKVSFFGGEPFLYFDGIKEILTHAKEFCASKEIELIADFTTNATLITQEQIDFLRSYRCHFQVPLDGNRVIHNRIKKGRDSSADMYQKTMDALRLIDAYLPNRWVAVRVNFDNRVLREIDEIIQDLEFFDRRKGYVILKKVWQIPKDQVDTESLFLAIQKFFDKKFLVDYYIMPKGCVCFAEKYRMTLFNYDGKIFKCSTLSSFDEEHTLGTLNFENGQVRWNPTKISHWMKDMIPEKCKKCEWFPACLGPCNRQLMAHPGEEICTFDSINMSRKEFLMYILKYRLLQNEWREVN